MSDMGWKEEPSRWGADYLAEETSGALRATVPKGGLAGEIEAMIAASDSGDVVEVITPILNDERVVGLICDARSRGAIFKVLTSLFDGRGRVVTRGWDESGNVDAHQRAIRQLAKAGVLLRSPENTPHVKLVHLVGKALCFGSANLAKESLRGQAVEAAIVLEAAISRSAFEEAFEMLWTTSPHSLLFRSQSISLQSRPPRRHVDWQAEKCSWGIDDGMELLLSHPSGKPVIASRLAGLLDQAQERVILAALSCYDINEVPVFGDAVEGCLRRNVDVDVIVRPEHFKKEQYPEPNTKKLLEMGLQLMGVTGLHAKGFLIDKKLCGILSGNYNPFSLDAGRKKDGKHVANVEMSVYGNAGAPSFRDLSNFLAALADSPTHRHIAS